MLQQIAKPYPQYSKQLSHIHATANSQAVSTLQQIAKSYPL